MKTFRHCDHHRTPENTDARSRCRECYRTHMRQYMAARRAGIRPPTLPPRPRRELPPRDRQRQRAVLSLPPHERNNTERNNAIRAAVAAGARQTDIASHYGITRTRVEQIVRPDRQRARSAVQNAIRSGRLVRPTSCERCQCQTKNIHSHHTDYSRPLDVLWLCRSCHGRADRELRQPLVVARRLERKAVHKNNVRRQAVARTARRREKYRARAQHSVTVLRALVTYTGHVPTYAELATILLRRPVERNGAVVCLANYLGSFSRRKPYWRRVQALYRLAGYRQRPSGTPGHVSGSKAASRAYRAAA